MSKRLPKELKRLRHELRLVFGRGSYEEAHSRADWVYALRLEERRDDRRRKREKSGSKQCSRRAKR
jgi:hypothetical protein